VVVRWLVVDQLFSAVLLIILDLKLLLPPSRVILSLFMEFVLPVRFF